MTLTGNTNNQPSGSRNLGPLTIALSAAVDTVTTTTLASGANTITVPAGATVAVILGPNSSNPQPNPNWGGTLTVKGVTGDTGIVVSAKYPTMLTFDTAPANFVITASIAGANIEIWWA